MGSNNFLDIADLTVESLRAILVSAVRMKKEWKEGNRTSQRSLLTDKTLAMIFEHPSTRTRVSFSVGMRQLGGQCLVLPHNQLQLGRGETLADTAQVMSRFVDCIVFRTGDHANLIELASHSNIPVINGLTSFSHPCQVMADVMTFEEHLGSIKGRTIAWVGDGNNMVNSWLHAAARLHFSFRIASPDSYRPDEDVLSWARAQNADITLCDNVGAAVSGADCVVTDAWVSMGNRDESRRRAAFRSYSVDASVMDMAAPEAIFMHCLPAHRGEEVTAEVIDGSRSVVFDEAENRLHVQKALLTWCLLGSI